MAIAVRVGNPTSNWVSHLHVASYQESRSISPNCTTEDCFGRVGESQTTTANAFSLVEPSSEAARSPQTVTVAFDGSSAQICPQVAPTHPPENCGGRSKPGVKKSANRRLPITASVLFSIVTQKRILPSGLAESPREVSGQGNSFFGAGRFASLGFWGVGLAGGNGL